MLVFQTYPVGVELACFLLQWICMARCWPHEWNALYSALNRNLLKAKVITLEKWDNHLFSWWLLFRKVHSVITSVALLYMCVKIKKRCLRTVPTIVTAHIFCACQGSRARRERNAQHAAHADWFCFLYVWEVLVISCGKNASFFNRWKIISIYLVILWKPKKYAYVAISAVWSIWPNIL